MNRRFLLGRVTIRILTLTAIWGMGLLVLAGCFPTGPDVWLQIANRTWVEKGGDETNIVVRVKNTGNQALSSEQGHFLSYHLLNDAGEMIQFDNPRTEIPKLEPGEVKDIPMKVKVPPVAGEYLVEADIVQEGVAWFEEKGNRTATGKLIVLSDAPTQYLAIIESSIKQVELEEDGWVDISLQLNNQGTLTWESTGENPVNLSYHLLNPDGSVLQFDNPRVSFEIPVGPNQTTEVTVRLEGRQFPAPGEYVVEFDLVHEGVTWFAEQGSSVLSLPVTVQPMSASHVMLGDMFHPKTSAIESSVEEFNYLWKMIEKTLAYTYKEFKKDGNTYAGFVAGSGYPQFWVRDHNTILPGARWFYDKPALTSWIELHLAHQKQNGEIQDWVDFQGRFDKNTVETDQETSLIQGSAYYLKATGDTNWLKKNINGMTIADRLHLALSYVWSQKRDPSTGLIVGAHTIDWGDVDIIDKDQKAIYTDNETVWTVDIYDQSMFVLAAKDLAWIFGHLLGDQEKAKDLENKADFIIQKTRELLWQPQKGFFLVHRHITPYHHDFDESDMFAMGGNAVAILSGIADENMAKQIFETAIDRQQKYGMSTIAGVMLPPYPQGTFKHPAVSQEYHYQNGGQWDWFAGRLILSMYESGYSELATEKLKEIAKKNIKNKGFFEWDNQEGAGKGSAWFAGTAGVIANALIKGYYGVNFNYDHLEISPKLAEKSGKIALIETATSNFISYKYKYDKTNSSSSISLNVHSNHKGKCDFSVTLPADMRGDFVVLNNGQIIPFKLKLMGNDRIIIFSTSLSEGNINIEIIAKQ